MQKENKRSGCRRSFSKLSQTAEDVCYLALARRRRHRQRRSSALNWVASGNLREVDFPGGRPFKLRFNHKHSTFSPFVASRNDFSPRGMAWSMEQHALCTVFCVGECCRWSSDAKRWTQPAPTVKAIRGRRFVVPLFLCVFHLSAE